MQKKLKIFYTQECFRNEKHQAGRFRQFTQLGVEIINSKEDFSKELQKLANDLISLERTDIKLNSDVTRGLDYYKDGKGFEITCEALGSSKQLCGGGEYDSGIGFAIGID